MTLSFGNMTVNLNIFNVIKGLGDEEDMCEINMVDFVVQKYLDNVSHDDPLKSCLVSPSWDEEVTTLESEFLHSIIGIKMYWKLMGGHLNLKLCHQMRIRHCLLRRGHLSLS